MGYTAGTLDLSVLGTSDSAVASIDKTVKSLNSLSRALGKINATQTVLAGNQISLLFEKISSSANKLDSSKLLTFASAAKSLSSISKIGNLEKVDFNKVGAGFNNLTVAITPFIAKVKEAEASLTALYGILNKSSGKKIGNLLNTTTTPKPTKTTKNPLTGILRVGSWTAVLYAARRLGGVMADIVTKGADFGETLNLWKVAMGDEFLPQATEFVNKLNEAYGISKETLMNSQAIFKNMLGSLGEISSAQAYHLSEGITQMALDYASLYNVTFESAMTKFQAALAGQVRPIRSVSGYDITENTLFQLYQELGGTKTMRQLSRTEKQLLAIYAVFEQMGRSGATGDLERTINSFANQSRVLADAWKDVQTYAGLTVTRLLEQHKVMQYVNAVLIFMSRMLEGVATALDTGLGNSGDVFGDVENGALETTEAVEQLQSALLDFDKFRALDQSNSIENALGLDETILNAMSKYDSILENAELESRKIADNWLKILGFVDANNDGIIDMQGGIDALIEKINKIDWGDVSEDFVDSLILAIGEFGNWIRNADWNKLGKDLAEAISNADWVGLIFSVIDLAFVLGDALSEAIESAIININWRRILGEQLPKLLSEAFVFAIEVSLPSLLLKAAEAFGNLFRAIITPKYVETFGIQGYANGGLPDKGSIFRAGEAGAEIVYNTPSGQSGVANVKQIAQATYSGTMRALNDWWGGSQAKGDIPQLKEANATGIYQAVTGVAKSQGKVWANV